MDHMNHMDHGPNTGHHSSSPSTIMNHATDGHGVDHANGAHGVDHASGGHGTFFVLSSEVTLWFESWTVNSDGGLLGLCVGIFLMAALYEGLKWVREYLYQRALNDAKTRTAMKTRLHAAESNGGVASSQFEIEEQMEAKISTLLRLPIVDHVIQTFMHMLQVFISYMLMLAFMTYNVWLGIALLIGSGVGYFLFSARIPKSVPVSKMSEHCH